MPLLTPDQALGIFMLLTSFAAIAIGGIAVAIEYLRKRCAARQQRHRSRQRMLR